LQDRLNASEWLTKFPFVSADHWAHNPKVAGSNPGEGGQAALLGTKPEMLVRRGLHARGLCYRLHAKSLPGRPDLVFPEYQTALFIHGCFWHANGCPLSKLPETRRDFWARKLSGNVARDRANADPLVYGGWQVVIVWECSLRGPQRMAAYDPLDFIAATVRVGYPAREVEIPGVLLHNQPPVLQSSQPRIRTA
jgi:DNA mismatch endonuclease (patch repair protein)